MATERKEALDTKIDSMFHYPTILKAAQEHFTDPKKVDYISVYQWLGKHVIGLIHDIKERLAFRLRQDLWNKTDPDKLEE